MTKASATIDFSLKWTKDNHEYDYSVQLATRADDDSWTYHAESVTKDNQVVFCRCNRLKERINNQVGYYKLADALATDEYIPVSEYIGSYGVYQPNALALRGTIADPAQGTPIGLHGGRLAEAAGVLFKTIDNDQMFGSLHVDEVLELIEWASGFNIARPRGATLNPCVPSTQQVIEFRDRYLKNTAVFTGYDASEGALYVLFMLCLAMHLQAPGMFGIDSFDHAMNPRLAKKLIQVFSRLVIDSGRTAFMTTRNPLILDGLDLSDDRIRLFAADRDAQGHIVLNRIRIPENLVHTGQSLSRLWADGYWGGS